MPSDDRIDRDEYSALLMRHPSCLSRWFCTQLGLRWSCQETADYHKHLDPIIVPAHQCDRTLCLLNR
jgi:aminoglycoside/choline kinase family phosphotransferase